MDVLFSKALSPSLEFRCLSKNIYQIRNETRRVNLSVSSRIEEQAKASSPTARGAALYLLTRTCGLSWCLISLLL